MMTVFTNAENLTITSVTDNNRDLLEERIKHPTIMQKKTPLFLMEFFGGP